MRKPGESGLVELTSQYSAHETTNRLESLLLGKGITVFARIDHAGEAAKVGLSMRPTVVLIFGSPRAGTPLMLAAPSLAIDLPLKALIWEDEAGLVKLAYNNPEYLMHRHGFPAELLPGIAAVRPLLEEAAR